MAYPLFGNTFLASTFKIGQWFSPGPPSITQTTRI